MRRAAIVSVLVFVSVVAGCGGGGSSSKDSYVKKNTDLVGKLPLYPGAKLTRKATTGYNVGGNKIVGYQTRYLYRLPATAKAPNVEVFYLKQMPAAGWKQVSSLTGPVLNYRKGNGFVSVNLTAARSHVLEYLIDQNFFSHVKK